MTNTCIVALFLFVFSPNNTNPKMHLPHNQIYVTSDGVEVRWDHVNNMWVVNSPTSGGPEGGTTGALHHYIMQKQQLQVYPHQISPQNNPPYNFETTLNPTPSQQPTALGADIQADGGGLDRTDDELMFLFDVIHRKSVRLRKDIEVLQQVTRIIWFAFSNHMIFLYFKFFYF